LLFGFRVQSVLATIRWGVVRNLVMKKVELFVYEKGTLASSCSSHLSAGLSRLPRKEFYESKVQKEELPKEHLKQIKTLLCLFDLLFDVQPCVYTVEHTSCSCALLLQPILTGARWLLRVLCLLATVNTRRVGVSPRSFLS